MSYYPGGCCSLFASAVSVENCYVVLVLKWLNNISISKMQDGLQNVEMYTILSLVVSFQQWYFTVWTSKIWFNKTGLQWFYRK